ncbi:20028_t:CDS:2 [Entrophospora sp. SA101]|nr:20028_t:CDS:2 [Entrophospora sp. SA101]CAJ0906358.1 12004_t:CDS:2 [Entrophospora sp. SA101]
MKKAAQEFNFDKAAEYRDLILDLQRAEIALLNSLLGGLVGYAGNGKNVSEQEY